MAGREDGSKREDKREDEEEKGRVSRGNNDTS
jgi:hypothetical protein